MKRTVITAITVAAVGTAACRDTSAPASQLAITMASAYSAAPAGFTNLASTYTAASPGAFIPDFTRDGGGSGGHGRGGFEGFGGRGDGPGFGLGLMGGGLFGPFLGDDFGFFFHSDSACTYASANGATTCGPVTTRDGLVVTRVTKYTTASGQAQQKIDSTTNTVSSTVTVAGTATRRDSSKSVVDESSAQTITGLAKGSAQRTVTGTSAGTETTTGTSQQGAFSAKRVVGDTVNAVVIPAPTTDNPRPYPSAGTIIRSMQATVTIDGQSPASSSRREVITYDGSATAKVDITQDGTTQNCTLPLPHGRLSCS